MDKKTQDIIVFDSVCSLCNGAVDLILKYDKKKNFLFTPLQSEIGTRLLDEFRLALWIHYRMMLSVKNS